MIKSIAIQNFILIDELKINFDKTLNVITGETGAGKSIIINAIDIAFGSKFTKDIIKTGEQRAIIELVIEDKNDTTKELLKGNGIECESNEITISKEISETSSRSRVNGSLVSQDFIKDLREKLIDIHSQHQTYTYIQPKYHIHLLDTFSDEKHKSALENFKNLYRYYIELNKKYETLKNLSSQTQNQVDLLKFQVEEIDSAVIEDVEEDIKIEKELDILSNAQNLKNLTYSSYWQLYGDDDNLINALNEIKFNLSKASECDDKILPMQGAIIDALETLKDASNQLRSYSENLEPDEQKMAEISDRIEILQKIKRKYGKTLAEVIENYNKMAEDLKNIEFSCDEMIKIEHELKEIEPKLQACATSLSESRKQSASILSELITNELEKLELPKSRFKVDITPSPLNANGIDNVEFLITTNISEDLKPLAKVASGGEISRVMLAIKTIFANADNVDTVIFDEIDTGISGKASQSVAEELTKLSQNHQTIVITHQPIIAARGIKHFYVAKSQKDITKVKVHDLNDENKLKALAMLASGDITEESLNFAKTLMQF